MFDCLLISIYKYFFDDLIVLVTVSFDESYQFDYFSLNALHFWSILRDFKNLEEHICFEEMINQKIEWSCAR